MSLETILNCLICLNNHNNDETKPLSLVPCGHSFCKTCVSKLSEKLCPLCKCYFNQTIVNWSIISVLSNSK